MGLKALEFPAILPLLLFISDCYAPSPSPLSLSLSLAERDLSLQIGEEFVLSLNATASYPRNETFDSTLFFEYSVPLEDRYIQPLSNLTLTQAFSGTELLVKGKGAGRLTILAGIKPPLPGTNYTGDDLFLRVSVYKLPALNLISSIVGWIYFVAWSVSFYPQILQNYRRKSVYGLSLEFVSLNVTGFFVYSLYNVCLFWVKAIQAEYLTEDPTGSIPVQVNDVVFSLHALFASGLTGVQCLIYDRGSQTISYFGRSLLCGIFTFLFLLLVVTLSGAIRWLTFLDLCSWTKLLITLIKYVPQGWLNYKRKSTSGWSIGNVLLDFTGGGFSLLQMFLLAFNHDDWFSIFGDFTKFGLGLFSITFDIFFILQHYVLYRNHLEYEPIEGTHTPTPFNEDALTTSNHLNSSLEEGVQVRGSGSVDSLSSFAGQGQGQGQGGHEESDGES